MKFIARSLFILLLLYGVVFAIGNAYLIRSGASLTWAILFAAGFIAIQFLLGPWIISHILDIYWLDQGGSSIPDVNRQFVEKLCAERGLKVPRLGIIYSGTPNAFAFGHVPHNARVVITSGLLEVLTPDEVNAVLAHEIGHVEHWDFVVMTIASLAPLLLYQIYVVTERISNFRALAFTSYLAYLASQFVVLLLNRTREYFADNYSAEVTRAPDTLASALVKIAYGMVREHGEYSKVMEAGTKEEKGDARRAYRLGGALAIMGISHLRSGASLALGANPQEAAAVMRWDLVNPWAKFYELNSTHPLTALRVRELNRSAASMNQEVKYSLPLERDIHWGSFPLEFLLWAAPLVLTAALLAEFWLPGIWQFLGITLPSNAKPALLIAAGAAWLVRIMYRYRGEFQDAPIGLLLEDLNVSQMRPRAVRVRGVIRGRGEPGAFWSPELVVKDSTGMMFILYRPSIPFARFFFATGYVEGLIGQEVTVEGWYRRGLTPYVEMRKLTGPDGKVHRTYSRWIQMGLAGLAIVIGYLWFTGF
jgi:heat shock protein HtpX